MKRMRSLLALATVCALAGLGGACSAPNGPNAPAAPPPTTAPTASAPAGPVAASTPAPAASPGTASGPATPLPSVDPSKPQFTTKHYQGVGVITKIDQDMGTVELNHEEIKGLMPPMTMSYYLKSKSMLPGLRVGQKVDFTIEDYGGNETISAITPRTK